jgi:hypothetical protein
VGVISYSNIQQGFQVCVSLGCEAYSLRLTFETPVEEKLVQVSRTEWFLTDIYLLKDGFVKF